MIVEVKCKGSDVANIDDLHPFQGELKTLSKENYDKLKNEILTLGFSEPISVWADLNKLNILNGHQRLRTLKQMRDEGYEVPPIPISLVDAKDVKEAKKKVLALTSQYGEIDNQGLYEFIFEADISMQEVKEEFRFPEIDLDKFEAEFFETKEPKTDEDAIPDNVEPIAKLGDLFQLGNHRLLCGDSTNKVQIDRLMGGEKADMVFTDPPYGIDVPCNRVEHVKTFKKQGIAKKGEYRQIQGDQTTDVANSAIKLCQTLDLDCEIYWGGNYYDLDPSPCWIVWDKRVEENQSDLNSDCELAWVKHKHKKSVRIFRHLWKGMIKASEKNEKRVHPTQKPIALAEWCFENYGDPKSVLDLFGGSGSTLIACEKTNRRCFMMEIDPHYCDVIIKRWEDYTGQKANKI